MAWEEERPAAVPGIAAEPELERLAGRLRELRLERRQTLDELSALSGLSKTYLSRIESGDRRPSLGALVALARAWDVALASLFAQTGGPATTRVRRHASAEWTGDRHGEGVIRVGSGALEGTYSEQRRREGTGLNPEELIGAAQAGCFTMRLASLLTGEGLPPEHLATDAEVHGEFSGTGFRITHLELVTRARVPGLSAAGLRELAERARRRCPVSQALAGLDIVVRAELV
jgi:osmotically inducible protein OsmC